MLRGLDGVVLLDGSWSEAKTLWWRNPWLLKLRRLVLDPQRGLALRPAAPRAAARGVVDPRSRRLAAEASRPGLGPDAEAALLAAFDLIPG